MEDTEKVKKEYEIGVLIRKEDDIPEVRRIVEQHGGVFTTDFRAKKIALAYPIKHETEALFAFARFKRSPRWRNNLSRISRPRMSSCVRLFGSCQNIPARYGGRHERNVLRQTGSQHQAPSSAPPVHTLSNEALTKKIEEMLK